MAATQTRNGTAPKVRPLPPITVARFREATRLIDRLLAENVDTFAAAAERYAAARRDASTRTLSPEESAQVAAALAASVADGSDAVAIAERVQGSTLRAQVDPPRLEALLAAGASTAPAWIDAALVLVALVELDPVAFADAREAGDLDDVLAAYQRDELEELPIADAKARAEAALAHVGAAVGESAGEAWGVVERMIGSALREAVAGYSTTPDARPIDLSISSSSTGSDAPTDGRDASSSTD